MKFDWTKPRYWYHISRKDLGDAKLFEPVENWANRDAMEPKGARICVAPSIAHCLVATVSTFQMTIYRTKTRMVAKRAHSDVWDAAITKEGWFLEPVEFVKIGVFNPQDFYKQCEKDGVHNATLEVCAMCEKSESRRILTLIRKMDMSNCILWSKTVDNPIEPVIV